MGFQLPLLSTLVWLPILGGLLTFLREIAPIHLLRGPP